MKKEELTTIAQLLEMPRINGRAYGVLNADGTHKKVVPELIWIIRTYHFSISRDRAQISISDRPTDPVYIAMVHTKFGSRAVLYFSSISQFNTSESKKNLPFFVDVDRQYDDFAPALKNVDLTFSDPYIRLGDGPNFDIHFYVATFPSQTTSLSFQIRPDTDNRQMQKLWNGFITTSEYLTSQYKNERLAEVVKRQLPLFNLDE